MYCEIFEFTLWSIETLRAWKSKVMSTFDPWSSCGSVDLFCLILLRILFRHGAQLITTLRSTMLIGDYNVLMITWSLLSPAQGPCHNTDWVTWICTNCTGWYNSIIPWYFTRPLEGSVEEPWRACEVWQIDQKRLMKAKSSWWRSSRTGTLVDVNLDAWLPPLTKLKLQRNWISSS